MYMNINNVFTIVFAIYENQLKIILGLLGDSAARFVQPRLSPQPLFLIPTYPSTPTSSPYTRLNLRKMIKSRDLRKERLGISTIQERPSQIQV